MTPERRKALLTIVATLVLGIAIGVLATGLMARQFYHERYSHQEKKEKKEGRKGSFTERIFRVVKADSNQRKLMKPIIGQTINELDKIEDKSNHDAYAQLDSLRIKLSPILNPHQREKLHHYLTAKRKSLEKEEAKEHERERHGH